MDASTVVTALMTGATLALKETAAEAVKDCYAGLKSIIVGRFKIGSVSALERDPSDHDFQKSLEKEISLSPGVLNDPEVAQAIAYLYNSIEECTPASHLAEFGIDVRSIKSQRDTVIRDISGFKTGIRSNSIESGQDTAIVNISGKPRA